MSLKGGQFMKHFRQILQLCATIILISALLSCGKLSTKTTRNVDSVYYKSAVELTSAIQRGEITSSELLNLYLKRIQRYNGAVNAVVAMDVDAARARAAQADKALAQGQIWGPLHGLPMTVKDTYEVVGMPATSGDPELKNYIPERNAIAVQRLIDAGAIVFGKTNVPFHAMDFQTFNKVYGTTNNPWDLTRTPGGSSGGSATALAMGFTPLELGSDIAGSLRNPAHYTGVYGHKPTFGIVPRSGHIGVVPRYEDIPSLPGKVAPYQMSEMPLSVAGPMARSTEDLALAMEILTTPGKSDMDSSRPELLSPPKKPLQDYRVAAWFTDSYSGAEIDAEVKSVLLKAVNKLRKADVQVDETAPPGISLEESRQLWLSIFVQRNHLPLPEALVTRQKKMQAKWAAFFESYDVLLAPVTPTVAFPHIQTQPMFERTLVINGKDHRYMENLTWAMMAVVSGLPVTAAPVGLSDSGLPVGVQIIGARLDDRKTIAFANGLSKLVGGFVAPPSYKE
jgi:amidase